MGEDRTEAFVQNGRNERGGRTKEKDRMNWGSEGDRERDGGRQGGTRSASLQMRALEARRQFKKTWLLLRHDRLLIPHPRARVHVRT